MMPMSLKYYLVNLGAFFGTLPFIAPVPINSDIQYPIFLMCAMVFFLDLLTTNITLRKIELYFLFVAIISFVYIHPFNEYDYRIVKRVGLLFGFLIFYVYSRYWNMVKSKYILVGIYVNFIAVIIHFLVPNVFVNSASFITRTIKEVSGGRGISGLAPEPGFLGAMCAFFVLISYVLLNEGRISNRQFIVVLIVSVVMMVLSQSGTSVLFLFVLLGLFFLFGRYTLWKRVLTGICVTLSIIVFLNYFGVSGRGILIAQKLSEDPALVFITDEAVANRGIAIAVGISSIGQGYILGHGVGTLPYVGHEIISNSYFGEVYSHVIGQASGLLSALGQYLVELGAIFIILIVWLYSNTRAHPYVKIVRITSFIYLLASFSILFPPLWLLLASTDSRNLRNGFRSMSSNGQSLGHLIPDSLAIRSSDKQQAKESMSKEK